MPELCRGGNEDVTTEDVFRLLRGDITPADIRLRRERARFKEHWQHQPTRRVLGEYKRHCRDGYVYADHLPGYAAEVFKEILATREHVLNKPEAKKLRREKAKQRHGRNKSRNR